MVYSLHFHKLHYMTGFSFKFFCGPLNHNPNWHALEAQKNQWHKFEPLICCRSQDIFEKLQTLRSAFLDFFGLS